VDSNLGGRFANEKLQGTAGRFSAVADLVGVSASWKIIRMPDEQKCDNFGSAAQWK
jgi:hypothetical protein